MVIGGAAVELPELFAGLLVSLWLLSFVGRGDDLGDVLAVWQTWSSELIGALPASRAKLSQSSW